MGSRRTVRQVGSLLLHRGAGTIRAVIRGSTAHMAVEVSAVAVAAFAAVAGVHTRITIGTRYPGAVRRTVAV